MKCQIKKKDNSRCDKDSAIVHDKLHMCKQHHKTFMKNNMHQYGTCLDIDEEYKNLTIREYLYTTKIPLDQLDD